MSDYFVLLPYVSVALLFAGSAGLLSGWARRHRYSGLRVEDGALSHPSEWRPSGKIDFVTAKVPKDAQQAAPFLLKVEEYCVFQSAAGTKHIKVRWRDASLAEAKHVASHHNAVGIIFERELPIVTRAPKLVGDLSLVPASDRTPEGRTAFL